MSPILGILCQFSINDSEIDKFSSTALRWLSRNLVVIFVCGSLSENLGLVQFQKHTRVIYPKLVLKFKILVRHKRATCGKVRGMSYNSVQFKIASDI